MTVQVLHGELSVRLGPSLYNAGCDKVGCITPAIACLVKLHMESVALQDPPSNSPSMYRYLTTSLLRSSNFSFRNCSAAGAVLVELDGSTCFRDIAVLGANPVCLVT